ncbi:MAG: cytochrome c biogenesis protein CcmG/thiol:disulfide interchange protein DsbE [Acidimicrobiales bacterium]|jgi:cytochrome c biogenesis protein CcmG/thiol:disulfide interchange protein DsbE
MVNEGERPALRRLIVAAAVVMFGVWAGFLALAEPKLPDFEASGEPQELPTEGSFPSISTIEFGQILVGARGQPVVVNVWASWCAPCRTEMPLLQDAAIAFAGEAVIFGVASNDDPGESMRFLEELGATYPNVFDATGEIRVALGLTAYPTTYVFGADGTLRARVNGGISEQRLAGLIEDALE